MHLERAPVYPGDHASVYPDTESPKLDQRPPTPPVEPSQSPRNSNENLIEQHQKIVKM